MRRSALARASGVLLLAMAAPAAAQPPTPTTPGAASAPVAEAPLDGGGSLFGEAWNSFELTGRINSTAGDPARFQRYEDMRSGLLFTGARVLRETDQWNASAGADNVGWRDQRFFGSYERVGRFSVSGLWDQIPQFYSVDTRTPFTSAGEGILVLDDNVQRAIQNKQTTLNAYNAISPQFDLRERRDIGTFRVGATPTLRLDLTGGFTTTKHSGELPWGASFGFSNDNEVALPYKSRTNDLDLGAEWNNGRAMLRGAFTGSWFENQSQTLLWDSPLQLDDTPTIPGRGQMALWPTNSLQMLSTAGYAKLARRTQLSGSLAFGWWNNDEALLPFTVNPTLPQFTLPRSSTEAAAHTTSTTLNLVSRPLDEWRFSARFRHYGFDNQMPDTPIPQFINYDTSVKASSTGGPELFAHDRNTFDADATWMGLGALALTVGYTNNNNGYDHRIYESSNEHVFQLKADAVGTQFVTFRAAYQHGSRTGSGLDEAGLVQIGEQPALRHYDVANRSRNQFTGQVDVTPNEALLISASAGIGNDDFDDSYFGLQEASFRTLSFGVDYQLPGGLGVGGSYNFERYAGDQQSRSASPGDQANDPNRDWTVDSRERVHYFSIYVRPPRIGENTEARFAYDYAKSTGDYLYAVGPALPPPSQLPQVFNKLQELRLDVRHRLTGRLAATLAYEYEPYRIFDFAFDPSVINGIVQPSTLVLGYVYRPYTAHTARIGILYRW